MIIALIQANELDLTAVRQFRRRFNSKLTNRMHKTRNFTIFLFSQQSRVYFRVERFASLIFQQSLYLFLKNQQMMLKKERSLKTLKHTENHWSVDFIMVVIPVIVHGQFTQLYTKSPRILRKIVESSYIYFSLIRLKLHLYITEM